MRINLFHISKKMTKFACLKNENIKLYIINKNKLKKVRYKLQELLITLKCQKHCMAL